MRAFDYASAATLDAALGSVGRDARPLAGGTDLLTLMKADLARPARLIDLKRAAGVPRGVAETADGVSIGALTTLAEIETDPLIGQRYAALAGAAGLAATPQLRNMATLAGNLLQRPRCWYFRDPEINCWLKGGEECQARDGQNQQHAIFDLSPCVAVHPSDPATALLALDAAVRLRGRGARQGGSGERTVPLAEFFAPPSTERRTETILGEDEIILSIELPAPAQGMRSIYRKAMDRKVWAFALVGVAAALRLDGGMIADAHLVLGGVANVPWRAEAAERELIGAQPSEEAFVQAAERALAKAQPLAHNGYKVPLARGLIMGALRDLVADIGS